MVANQKLIYVSFDTFAMWCLNNKRMANICKTSQNDIFILFANN